MIILSFTYSIIYILTYLIIYRNSRVFRDPILGRARPFRARVLDKVFYVFVLVLLFTALLIIFITTKVYLHTYIIYDDICSVFFFFFSPMAFVRRVIKRLTYLLTYDQQWTIENEKKHTYVIYSVPYSFQYVNGHSYALRIAMQ